MDHKWGRQLTELGLGGVGATMCARDLRYEEPRYVLNVRFGANRYLYAIFPADTSMPIIFGNGSRPFLQVRFPYGEPVEPDVFG